MPVLRIMSIYWERTKLYGSDLSRARAEHKEFRAGLDVRLGQEMADAVRLHHDRTEDVIFGRIKVPRFTTEADLAFREMLRLRKQVVLAKRKICTPDCFFRESATPVTVLETTGLSWRMVEERCSEDGYLPVTQVLWLLNTARTTQQILPTEEQIWMWNADSGNHSYLPQEWLRILRRRKGRLIGFLQKAAELEEDVRCVF